MYHQPPAPASSQQWGRDVSRGTSVGLPGAASLISFLAFTGHPLAVPEHDHVHDHGRGQYNLKYSKANPWNFQGVTVTGVPKVTPVNTPCSHGDCCSSRSCGLL